MTQTSYASGLLFNTAHQLVRGRVYAILEKYNLSLSHWAVLGITVRATEGVRQAAVAREMGVQAPLVTVLADDLTEAKLIKRIPHHTDGRVKLLVGTAKGRKLAMAVEAELSLEIARLMHGVSAADVAAFQRTLKTIIANGTEA